VIGGGDWSPDRLVPDVWRAAQSGEPLKLRSPNATRPWQHVLDSLSGYLRYIEALSGDENVPRALNFGPPSGQSATVAEVAEKVGAALGLTHAWEQDAGEHPREMAALSLDPSLARETIGWSTRLSLDAALEWTAAWYAAYGSGRPALDLCADQIERYETLS
jgi:CDP-glucose 4,6-dehydratase